MNPITKFQGKTRFLSNFWPCQIVAKNGTIFPSAEHAYQASKSLLMTDWQRVLACKTPGEAKKVGRSLTIRPDWEQIRLLVMERILRQKFSPESELARLLLDTGEAKIQEGNTWHDNFWGNCVCSRCSNIEGENQLGKLLMKIRSIL